MKLKTLLPLSIFLLLQCAFLNASAQERKTASGKVTAKTTGDPLPGSTVKIKGTEFATVTDESGNFSISVPKTGAILVVSHLGMLDQEAAVPADGRLNIVMNDADATNMNEVVVVGYGTQKKSVVTGAISSVKASDLENMPLNRIEQSLQGRTSGVTIATNNGQPGAGATVRVRGITSFNNNNPLWVVDGVVVDNGGIGYLNQSDIESIEVLKDASSQAIYGARAAAGVILVTTKRGKSGALRVNYHGYYGIQAPTRKLDLLNATEYATLRNEAAVAAGQAKPFADPTIYGEGTDWQDVIFNNSARRQTHELSISGGNERSTYFASFGYFNQEGIVATDISKFKRLNFRLNSTHKLASWITFGQNLGYAYEKTLGIGNTNSEFGGPLSSAINLDPITPVIETDPAKLAMAPYLPTPGNMNGAGIRRDQFGNPYAIPQIVGQEFTNPLAYIQTRLGNYGWSDNLIGNAFLEAEPVKGLKLRSTLGGKLSFWGSESFSPLAWLKPTVVTSQTSYNRGSNRNLRWNLENTASYTKGFGEHNLTLLVGQGAYSDGISRNVNVTYFNIPADNFDDASLNFNVPADQKVSGGSESQEHYVSSLFARVNYDYGEKYLVQALVRRDGSSRFGSNNKYGVFPSFSMGWVATKESFFPATDVVNFLKVRGGYGVVGSDEIGDFAYVSTIGSGRSYAFGTSGSYLIGYSPNAPANPNLRWEETRQTNIGFDATLVNNLTVAFDWFKKKTIGILMNPRIPGYVGAISNPAANVADMENTGLELELGYRRRLGEFDLSLNGNISHYKNKITYLGDGILFSTTNQQTVQTTTYPITRSIIGQPFNSFFGFKTMGIFQNQEEIDAYVDKDGRKIQPNAVPGDFRWKDVDGNGVINENDRMILGNALPTVTYGMTLNAAYKGFDLVLFGQGGAGNKIYQGLRRLEVQEANWQRKALGRWTGEGSTNSYPRLTRDDRNNNFTNPSGFYLEDGDYFRIKVLQIGYSLPAALIRKAGLARARVYLMSENLVTFTKYSGYDPEIGGGSGAGIDRGFYPQARSFMAGVNLSF